MNENAADDVDVADGHTRPASDWDPDVAYAFFPEPEPDGVAGHSSEGGSPDADTLGSRAISRTTTRRASGKLEIESLIYSLARAGSSAVDGGKSFPSGEREPLIESGHPAARRIGLALVAVALVILALLWLRGPSDGPTNPRRTSTSPRQGRVTASPTVALAAANAPT